MSEDKAEAATKGRNRPGVAAIVTTLLMLGWVVSACIRSYQGVKVEIASEMMGAGIACALVYSRLSKGSSDEGDTP